MQKNKLLLLASSFTTLLLLVIAAGQEHFGKEWRDIQGQGRGEEGPIPVQLRQIVNPALGTSDRCVSCHVAMAPGEESVAGSPVLHRHTPAAHDPADYGCTVCHGGQGLATEKTDAHGDVDFWPQPMLPPGMSQAGCGTCHAYVGIPGAGVLAASRGAFERHSCLACHRVDGRGGVQRRASTLRRRGTPQPASPGLDGPELSRVGTTGYDARWYEDHLAKRAGEAADQNATPWSTVFHPIGEADRAALHTYLATRVGAPNLIEAKATFLSTGCLGCHTVGGVGGEEGPDLTRVGDKDPGQVDFAHVPGSRSLAAWNLEHFRSPGAVAPGSQMPVLGLTEDQIRKLTFYVLSLRRRDLPGSYLPKDRLRVARFGDREFTTDGATIFGAFCSGCHGLDGLGRRSPGLPAFPSIANPDFLSRVSDDFVAATVRLGRPGRRMPGWSRIAGGLRPDEITAVVSYLRTRSGIAAPSDPRPKRWVQGDARAGERLFASTCSGCHGATGQGGEGPALNNRVLLDAATDTYLADTIGKGRRGTAMAGFLTSSPARRTLAAAEIESIVAFLRTWQENVK
ncbi:MAG: c-type cytochrome [Acidobacteria bacterium]|nr:c-type cytochrome [Acidobacteriota bacterium]